MTLFYECKFLKNPERIYVGMASEASSWQQQQKQRATQTKVTRPDIPTDYTYISPVAESFVDRTRISWTFVTVAAILVVATGACVYNLKRR